MTEAKIFILSGPIQSGKTSRLLKWSVGRNDVAGILTPDMDGRRYFMDIVTKDLFPMEAVDEEINFLSVGKYKFSKAGFDHAAEILLKSVKDIIEYLIIDEIGPLELKGFGFHNALKTIIEKSPLSFNLILVVRENLVADVLNHFQIKSYKPFSEI